MRSIICLINLPPFDLASDLKAAFVHFFFHSIIAATTYLLAIFSCGFLITITIVTAAQISAEVCIILGKYHIVQRSTTQNYIIKMKKNESGRARYREGSYYFFLSLLRIICPDIYVPV